MLGEIRGEVRFKEPLSFHTSLRIGGTADISLAAVATAMIGVHLLIGIGEGIITALTVGSVLAVRPDLVYGARDLLPRQQLELRPSSTREPTL